MDGFLGAYLVGDDYWGNHRCLGNHDTILYEEPEQEIKTRQEAGKTLDKKVEDTEVKK